MTSCWFRLATTAFVLALSVSLSAVAFSQASETVLYDFQGGASGQNPLGLIADASGNFYGVTEAGGASGYGTIFKLSPVIGGGWTETVLYSFAGGASGQLPKGNLALDAAGNFYGTAWGGSTGYGIVYKLMLTRSGWVEQVLHTFTNGADGGSPLSGVTMDTAGNLYGTASSGGLTSCFEYYCGVVYKLSFVAGVGWKETVLHSFSGRDGAYPEAVPLLDADGNLWGTTPFGGWVSPKGFCGVQGCGVAYKLSPVAGGWKETVLHTFVGGETDGGFPFAGLTRDAEGNLYGVTGSGGAYLICVNGSGCGTAFELSPNADGTWTETLLHKFNGSDGADPYTAPVLDAFGNLYGSTNLGGYGYGTAFELSPSSSGWVFSSIYSFDGYAQGDSPDSSFVIDKAGNLFAVSGVGGNSNNVNCVDACGLIFELTP